jgi:hypothetical protein
VLPEGPIADERGPCTQAPPPLVRGEGGAAGLPHISCLWSDCCNRSYDSFRCRKCVFNWGVTGHLRWCAAPANSGSRGPRLPGKAGTPLRNTAHVVRGGARPPPLAHRR